MWQPGDDIGDEGINKRCTNYYAQNLDSDVDAQLKCQTICLNFFKTYGNDCVGIVMNNKNKHECITCYDAILEDVMNDQYTEYVFYRNNEGKYFVVLHI